MLKFFSHAYTKLTGDLFDVIENDDVKLLLEMIKNKEAADHCCINGCYLLYDLCARDAFKSLVALLKLGANPDLVNKRPLPWTPLRFAVRNKVEHLIRILIMHGANPDKPEPDSAYATPRNMANDEMKKIIQEVEQHYKLLLSLKEDYEDLKTRADTAYKKTNMADARKLYQAAAEKQDKISNIWEQLYQQEDNSVFKSYYQEQQHRYSKQADQLRSLLSKGNTVISSSHAKGEGFSFQMRQRKVYQQKFQFTDETQKGENKLTI